MSATKNTTTKTAQTNRINPDVQSRFDEVFAAIKAVDPTLTFWKNQMLKEAHEYRKAQSLDGLNGILDRLAKHQKEMANIEAVAAEKARAAQEAEAAQKAAQAEADKLRLAAEEVENGRRNLVKEGWAKALKASAAWVQKENAAGHKGQKAFEEAFNAAYQKMAVRVAEVSYEDAEAVQVLVSDLQKLTGSVYQHQQNWCITCGAAITDLITPKKGKPFKPSYCRAHADVAKAIKADEKASNSGVITPEMIQTLQEDETFKGVRVEPAHGPAIKGGSKDPNYLDANEESEPTSEVAPVQKPRRRATLREQIVQEAGAEDEGQIEKIGGKRRK